MKKGFAIIAIICSIVFIGTVVKGLAVQDIHTISEVPHTCNMAYGALSRKKYDAALALLVSPAEMRQLNATLSTQEIIKIVSLRGASRIKRFLDYGKNVNPEINSDQTEAVYTDKSISFTFYKTGGQWYVKDFDKTFFITTLPDNLPSDEDVLKEVNAYFDTAIEHLEKRRDKEALFLLAPNDQKLYDVFKTNAEVTLKKFRETKAERMLTTLKKARSEKPKEIAWDKEWLHYRIGGDDFEVYKIGGKWCVGN